MLTVSAAGTQQSLLPGAVLPKRFMTSENVPSSSKKSTNRGRFAYSVAAIEVP